MFKKVLLILTTLVICLNASDFKIAAGAGYKKPLIEIIKEYEKNGEKIDSIFGNLKQISTQASQTDIALIIGDKNFLLKKSNLTFTDFKTLGEGKLVIAYPTGKTLNSIEDLTKNEIQKISMPQPSKAIYGIAGEEFLKNSALYEKVKDKLLIVATVPQAMTYVLTNEVDASLINLTETIANKKKIGGYILVDKKYYSPIEIVVGKLNNCTKKCENFLEFLTSETSKSIFEKYGL